MFTLYKLTKSKKKDGLVSYLPLNFFFLIFMGGLCRTKQPRYSKP
jgi:hypothetical protein